jgi:hypothetical protein
MKIKREGDGKEHGGGGERKGEGKENGERGWWLCEEE